ncbi:MAG: hypothetical protein KGJ60_00310 [Verrucomicrobiota bacterium]|nr:hypothetical protein [Verrucomicrobiota bacterium]
MKTVTINISLNSELAEFAQADARAEAFDSLNEYMRQLIRQRRQKKIEEDMKFLERAIAGAPPGDPSDEEMREIVSTQKAVRQRMRHARGI